MEQHKNIVIVGGGVIGLFSAYYLSEAGYDITVIEQSDGGEGCSTGNAGMIVPSHIFPLAMPGMIEKGLRWMLDEESPFYVKPKLNWNLLSWGMQFYKAANAKQVAKAKIALRDISWLSKQEYKNFVDKEKIDIGYEEKGLLMLCKTEKMYEEEAEAARQASAIGVKADLLTKAQVHKLEPETKPDVVGGVLYPGDAHLIPQVLVEKLKKIVQERGVQILYNTELLDVEAVNGKVKAVVYKKSDQMMLHHVQELIMAAGAWSQQVSKIVHTHMPMQAGKGYSISRPQLKNKKINIPSILMEARVAVTPFNASSIRFGGTMEIAGINKQINMNRVAGIVKAVPNFYPKYKLDMPAPSEVWYGLRPCSPDGLPYIGRSSRFSNLIFCTGHAMMGLSLAAGSGLLVAELVQKQKPSVALDMFKVERF